MELQQADRALLFCVIARPNEKKRFFLDLSAMI